MYAFCMFYIFICCLWLIYPLSIDCWAWLIFLHMPYLNHGSNIRRLTAGPPHKFREIEIIWCLQIIDKTYLVSFEIKLALPNNKWITVDLNCILHSSREINVIVLLAFSVYALAGLSEGSIRNFTGTMELITAILKLRVTSCLKLTWLFITNIVHHS